MSYGGGDGDIDPTLADESIDRAVPPSDREGGGANRDEKIPTEPTVRKTSSGSKVVPEKNYPPTPTWPRLWPAQNGQTDNQGGKW